MVVTEELTVKDPFAHTAAGLLIAVIVGKDDKAKATFCPLRLVVVPHEFATLNE